MNRPADGGAPEGLDALDDLISSARRRRPGADPLDDGAAGRPAGAEPAEHGAAAEHRAAAEHGARPEDPADRRRRWARALGLAVAGVAFAGFVADTVAAARLLADSGPGALAAVWPIGGIGMLAVAAMQAKYVDRFARVPVLVALCGAYAALFVVVAALFASAVPESVPAALAWLLADQLLFLLPLVLWSLAGDVFTAGQAVTVFPRISRWMYGGQFAGLAVAATSPRWLPDLGIDLAWLTVLPAIACAAVALTLPRALRGAAVSQGHGRSMSAGEAVRDTVALVGDLPAFSWLFRVSLLVMTAGALIEFTNLQVIADAVTDAGDLQTVYGAASLAVIVASWCIQRFVTPAVLRRQGVERALLVLPTAAVLAAGVLVAAGVSGRVPVALAGLFVWRLARRTIDASARQNAMATLPDERRARASFLVDLVPLAVGFIVFAPVGAVAAATGRPWLAAAVAVVVALAGAVTSRRIVATWEATQLSYRLKRRRRLG